MGKTIIAIRDVDEEVYRKFRTRSMQNRIKLGKAITLAMTEWLAEQNAKMKRKDICNLLKIKPFDFGNENLSEEIDEVLYGANKDKS
ncbi:MAG: hypothetical protein AABX23_05250 [Nanoarchaeota archaeon]